MQLGTANHDGNTMGRCKNDVHSNGSNEHCTYAFVACSSFLESSIQSKANRDGWNSTTLLIRC